jgi:HSP90 family molecular chaperone
MDRANNNLQDHKTDQIPFKAETRQLLQILIHSLYKEREIFLRELISNASDALTRMNYELLTNRDVIDPQEELKIHIKTDAENHLITIRDTGIGMTESEIRENLGTIAQSGVRAFIDAASSGVENLSDIIGQFGVGFYSAFMVAEWIQVTSRSYKPKERAVSWYSKGVDTFSIEEAEKDQRGTSIIIKLKEDASEFLQEYRLKSIIQKHSDFIPFPIFIGDEKEQINRQTAIWRQQSHDLNEDDYHDFYKHLTFDMESPLLHIHMVVDAPVQMYAILYIPKKAERSIFSPRKDDGIKLYSRKILIDEYNRDLLPEYFRFIQGVVDSEDLPLNISRETVQSNRLLSQLKKLDYKKGYRFS